MVEKKDDTEETKTVKEVVEDDQFIENPDKDQKELRKVNVNTIEDMRKRVNYIKKDLKPL